MLCCRVNSYIAQFEIENPLSQRILMISLNFGRCFSEIRPNALQKEKKKILILIEFRLGVEINILLLKLKPMFML